MAASGRPQICVYGVGNCAGRFSEVRRRSVANYYILNLAVADELFVLTLPFFCVTTYTADWAFGDAACRLTYALRETYKYTSLLTLVALSVDRCLATYHRLAHLRTIARGVAVCVVIWVVSVVGAGTPYAVYSRVLERAGRRRCVVGWPWTGWIAAQRAWTYGHLLIGVVVPLVVIAVANVLLLQRLRLFAGRTTSVRRGALRTLGTAAAVSTELPRTHGDADSSVRRQRASRNMARLVLAIVIIFVVCQLPYHIIEVFDVYAGFWTRKAGPIKPL